MPAAAVDEARRQFATALQSALTMREITEAFLRTAQRVIPARGLGLYRLCAESGTVLEVDANVAAPDFLAEYEDYGRTDDPVLDFVVENRLPIDSSRVVTAERWAASGARSALGVAGYEHSLEAPIVVSGVLFGTINFARTAAEPAFDDVDLASARVVSENLSLALERGVRFEHTCARSAVLEKALDRVPQALVVTDLESRVLFRNRAARNAQDMADGLVYPAPGNAIAACINEAMAEFRVHGKRAHTRSLRSVDRQLIARSYRLSGQHDAAVTLFFPCAERDGPQKMPAWNVLTPREHEIAELVGRGLTSRQVAEHVFISEHTVKQHLKRIFAKTDVRNRAELVQLIWASGRSEDPIASH